MKDLDKLAEGFRRFRQTYYQSDPHLFEQLNKGQHPNVLMIACSDSRVDPALLTDGEPGDLFVIRNVANLVPPYEPRSAHIGTLSAIEYAVMHLHVEHIIVKGHSNCGGIGGLWAADEFKSEFIGPWVQIARDVREKAMSRLRYESKEQQLRAMEVESVRLSLRNLMTYPWIAEKTKGNELMLHGWYFDMAAGDLLEVREDTEELRNLLR